MNVGRSSVVGHHISYKVLEGEQAHFTSVGSVFVNSVQKQNFRAYHVCARDSESIPYNKIKNFHLSLIWNSKTISVCLFNFCEVDFNKYFCEVDF